MGGNAEIMCKMKLRTCFSIAAMLDAWAAYTFWMSMQDITGKILNPLVCNCKNKTIEDIPDEVFALYIHNCAMEAITADATGVCDPPDSLDARILLRRVAKGNFKGLLGVFLRLRKKPRV